MAQYTFSFGQADAVRDQMATITNRVHSMLEELNGNVMKQISEWESDARREYDLAKQKWDAAAAAMPSALGRAEQTLQTISDGYLHVEHYGVDLWRG